MKIAVWHNLPSGGAKRALYYHVRGLVERGHELSCWSLDTADHSYLPLSEFATEHVISSRSNHRSRKGLSERLGSSFSMELDRMRAFDDASRECARQIEADNFDLLFANTALNYSVPYILRHLQMKKVLYLQEPRRFLYEARPVLPWVASASGDLDSSLFEPRKLMANYPTLETLRLQAKQEWLNAHACDYLLVNSYFSRESVLRSYGTEAKVCYLGVDTRLFRDLGLERERFVVGLGSFDPTKGIDLAVQAVSLLDEPRPPLVWIANSRNEAYEATIRELAQASGVDLRIHIALSDAELITLLNKATLLLYTSRLEPFGLAPLEANACGLPVVGIAEGGIRETVRDGVNGFLVDPEPKKIATAASRFLNEPGLAQQIGEQAVRHVQQHWNVDGSVERLEELLREALSTQKKD